MAGSTFQPPINLDPHQDPAQQTAFINQNFQSLAAALESNSFRIVKTGTTTIVALAAGNSVIQTVTHNLGFPPIGLYYLNISAQFVPLPYTLWGNSSQNLGVALLAVFVSDVDETTITFQCNNYDALFAGQNFPIKYYLLQETAAS